MNRESEAIAGWFRDNPEAVRRIEGHGPDALRAEIEAAIAVGNLEPIEPIICAALARVDWPAVAAAVA